MDNIYTISGTVISGDHYGEVLGFPTANIDTPDKTLKKIPKGVYGGTVTRTSDNTTYKAGIVVGAQNTVKPIKLEAHLIDFVDNVYGEQLVLHFKKFLRGIRQYDEESDLKRDIQKDIDVIRKLDF